ncbi:hypothetical protein NQZ68_025782 [Dissostichus eleginoides]|nr:hypothetical protein NQZ68_025782 [Dissostichus eleginoides]
MRPRAARLNAFSPRKVYYSPMQTDTGGAPRTEIYLQPGGGAETWTCAITLPGFSVVFLRVYARVWCRSAGRTEPEQPVGYGAPFSRKPSAVFSSPAFK